MTKTSYQNSLIGLLLLSLVIRIAIIYLGVWPINGDEAQYWSWGKHLAWGYYSKPPMVAWVIAFTTKLLGNGPIGLRIGSPIAYAITSVFIYLSGVRLFSPRIGFWCAILFLFIPGVTFSASIISTDPLLLTFWSIALYGLIRALESNKLQWWCFTGITLGFAFYSKYAAILFVFSLFFYLLLSNKQRKLFKCLGPYLVFMIPIVMLIPNLMWNYQNHFASVLAVSNNADLTGNLFHLGNLLNFVGSQFAVFGPILFGALIAVLIRLKRYLKDERYLLLIVFTFFTLGVMTAESFLSRAHANWSAPAYIAATLLVVSIIIERKKMAWLWAALVIHFLTIVGFIYMQPIVKTFHVPMDQKMTVTGWPGAMKKIENIRHQYPHNKILVNRRMLLTQLMYFGNIPLRDTFRWDPQGVIADQYDLVTHMQGQVGKNFLFFSYVKNTQGIENYFQQAQFIKQISLATLDGKPLELYVYHFVDFKGY